MGGVACRTLVVCGDDGLGLNRRVDVIAIEDGSVWLGEGDGGEEVE